MDSIKKTSEEPMSDGIRDLFNAIDRKNAKSRFTQTLSIFLILVAVGVGVVGIYKGNQNLALQNALAAQNKDHIDCIVKFLTTPIPDGQAHRVLSDPSGTCNIKFTP